MRMALSSTHKVSSMTEPEPEDDARPVEDLMMERIDKVIQGFAMEYDLDYGKVCGVLSLLAGYYAREYWEEAEGEGDDDLY